MKLANLRPNANILSLRDGTEVLFSYETPVALHVRGRGYLRTSTKWSNTTSRHIAAWLGGRDAETVSQEEIETIFNKY